MADETQNLSRRRIATDVIVTLLGLSALVIFVFRGERTALVIGVYSLLLGTSTAVVTYCLTQFTGISIETTEGGVTERGKEEESSEGRFKAAWQIFTGKALESDSDIEKDTGWLIGRLENILVLTLVFIGQYTALSVIFAAKSWVRVEDTASENTTYYLAGTMVNFTYSIVFGLVAIRLLDLC